jgi:hypothetical protein
MTFVLKLLAPLLAYIIFDSCAVPTTATTEFASFDKDDSVIGRRSFDDATSNSSGGGNDSYFDGVKTQNELSIIENLFSDHVSNGSIHPDAHNTEKRVTIRGKKTNVIQNGRTLQTTNKSGKGKSTNDVDSTCDLDVSKSSNNWIMHMNYSISSQLDALLGLFFFFHLHLKPFHLHFLQSHRSLLINVLHLWMDLQTPRPVTN